MDIGLDLGTTFSVIAVKGRIELAPGYSGAEYLEEIDVTILPSPTGNPTIPSVMWWEPDPDDPGNAGKGRYVFGDEAKQMAEEGKCPIMFSKRCIGTDEKLMLNGHAFTAREVAERFLRYMKEWAEMVTRQKVGRAVVTHPAYFTPNQREETLLAAKGAGLDIKEEQLIMEPCSAALAYTLSDMRDPLRVMSYDLGGGTFDVAVMEKIDGVIQMRKFHGDHLLGGYNFDCALLQWILDQLKAKGKVIPYDETNEEHRGRRARMLQVAEAVKIRLAEQKTDKIPVPVQVDFLVDDQGQRVQFRGQISREQYTALIREDLQKTIQCCRSALAGAGMEAEDLDAILLVGGSTKGKWVVDAVAKEFGAVGESYYPDLCVAAGAALFVAQLPPAPTGNDRITLSLDYQPKSVLPAVNISGTICPSQGSDLTPDACRSLRVHLETPEGSSMGPADIGDDGQFIFMQVTLLGDGSPSSFKVTVCESGKEIHHQDGSIVYIDVTKDGGSFTTGKIDLRLPRSLFLKAERMVAMAEEGVSLPAKCQVRLRRTFGGPKLDIPIFMENEPVGMVSVEDIPDEAGEGCMVIVDAEVTQGNEMRGKVLVYGPNGKTVVKEGPVRIAFPPIVIPEMSELLGRFDELKDQLEMAIVTAPPQDRARLAGPGKVLVRRIARKIEGQAPDRQELFEAIKELERVVNPPPDDMDPPRRDFENLVSECREAVAANPENPALKAFASQSDRIEAAGKEACAQKNNKKWKQVNETLQRIHANMAKAIQGLGSTQSHQETPPPAVLKAHAFRVIEGLGAALQAAREARKREGRAERWETHCDQCSRQIDHMASEIANIPDDAPKERVLAQVQSYLGPSEVLRKKIARIQAAVYLEFEERLEAKSALVPSASVLSPALATMGPLCRFQFSAFYPEKVGPEETGKLIASAHLASVAQEVVREVSRKMHLPVGVLLKAGTVAQSVPRQSAIKVTPDVPGLLFDVLEATMSLWEDAQSVEFRFKSQPVAVGRVCQGWVHFWLEGLAIADVAVSVFVAKDEVPDMFREALAQANARPYRRVFPSYSHTDTDIVERLEVYAAAFGDEYFRDVNRLRAGQRWKDELTGFIKMADLFQLFWSQQAADSQYVTQEWRHALQERSTRNDPYFLRPVYWTQQPAPIPSELGDLHFARVPL